MLSFSEELSFSVIGGEIGIVIDQGGWPENRWRWLGASPERISYTCKVQFFSLDDVTLGKADKLILVIFCFRTVCCLEIVLAFERIQRLALNRTSWGLFVLPWRRFRAWSAVMAVTLCKGIHSGNFHVIMLASRGLWPNHLLHVCAHMQYHLGFHFPYQSNPLSLKKSLSPLYQRHPLTIISLHLLPIPLLLHPTSPSVTSPFAFYHYSYWLEVGHRWLHYRSIADESDRHGWSRWSNSRTRSKPSSIVCRGLASSSCDLEEKG